MGTTDVYQVTSTVATKLFFFNVSFFRTTQIRRITQIGFQESSNQSKKMKRLLIITIIAIFLLTPSIRAGGKTPPCAAAPEGYDACSSTISNCYCQCCPVSAEMEMDLERGNRKWIDVVRTGVCKWFDNEYAPDVAKNAKHGCQRKYQLNLTMVSALAEKQRDQIVHK